MDLPATMPPGRAALVGCGAIGLVVASYTGWLRQLYYKAQVLVTLRLTLLGLGSESLETWIRTQFQLHTLMDLEVNRRLADGRVPVPAPPSRLQRLFFGRGTGFI